MTSRSSRTRRPTAPKRATTKPTRKAAARARSGAAPAASRKTIKPGTRLVRMWRGVAHEVLVDPDGFLFRGARYGSLSEAARAITGQRWSGHLFFGLRRRAFPDAAEARRAT